MILVTYLALSTLCPGWLVVDSNASQEFLQPVTAQISEQAVEDGKIKRYKTSQAAVNFLKKEEVLKTNAYDDGTGVITIGYGHTGNATGTKSPKLGDVITEEEAEELLKKDLEEFETNVFNRMKNYGVPLSQREFDFLILATFNRGNEIVGKSLYTAVANRDLDTIKTLMDKTIAGSDRAVKEGLKKRLKLEQDFLYDYSQYSPNTTTLGPITTPTIPDSELTSETPLEDERRKVQREALSRKTNIEKDVDEAYKSFETIVKQFFGIIPGGPKPEGKYGLLGDKIAEIVKRD